MDREKNDVDEQDVDELLELLWTLKERKVDSLDEVLRISEQEHPKSIINFMEKDGLVKMEDDRIFLSKKGDSMARGVIRRHRLAEVLLSQVFEVREEDIHTEACKFEHILSPEVTESVCTFLGHPPACSHGNPIPKGICCSRFKKEMRPLVLSLIDLSPGESGRIVFIAPKEHRRIDKLTSFGVIPGSTITLHQKTPSFIIKVGGTDLAIDADIAKEIYVKKA
ncbi:MAG: metal-dependent transcriptional regulator [Candidatus Hydrothermarchaeaceae archaeon]